MLPAIAPRLTRMNDRVRAIFEFSLRLRRGELVGLGWKRRKGERNGRRFGGEEVRSIEMKS
jgi:hypothetical protein